MSIAANAPHRYGNPAPLPNPGPSSLGVQGVPNTQGPDNNGLKRTSSSPSSPARRLIRCCTGAAAPTKSERLEKKRLERSWGKP